MTKSTAKTSTGRDRLKDYASNGKDTSPKAPAKGKATTEKIAIGEIDIRKVKIPIIGTSELIVHRFSEKQRKQIEDKQQGRAKGGRGERKPKEEYLAAFYMISGKPETKTAKYGVPAAGFKNAMVSACRYIDGLTMVLARGAFFVNPGLELIEIKSKSGPYMREDTVRLDGPSRSLDLRYRPAFGDWSCELEVAYNASVITAEQIVNLLSHAGFHVGVCEWRPERGGSNGMFIVDTSKFKTAA